ncbi:MAG: tRNA acetyltransferase [Amphiamblys sp. WSBS2006]|nr:MAG: tRNA acetyltransferase [Amphiamblys sp. WSBS2006]
MGSEVSVGTKGFFVTCVRGKEQQCCGEVVGMLRGAEEGAVGSTGVFMDDLEKELESKKKKSLFSAKGTGTPCLVFVSLPDEKTPTLVMKEILRRIKEGEHFELRFTQRLYPADYSCSAVKESLLQLIRGAVVPNLPSDKKTYSVQCQLWSCGVMEKDELKRAVAAEVGERYKVDLKAPDFVILVVGLKSYCGVSVLGEWCETKGYNLGAFINGK